jgi:hypothetical protein
MAKRHKDDTKTFDELNYAEQAKSINGQIISLMKSINAHERRAIKEKRGTSLCKITKTLQNKVNDLQEKLQERAEEISKKLL